MGFEIFLKEKTIFSVWFFFGADMLYFELGIGKSAEKTGKIRFAFCDFSAYNTSYTPIVSGGLHNTYEKDKSFYGRNNSKFYFIFT